MKISLWNKIEEERQPVLKHKIAQILNDLISENFTENEMKEIVMNCRGNLTLYLAS